MTEDQKKNLETQLWGIANLLRDQISADDSFNFLDYIHGFIIFINSLQKNNKTNCHHLRRKILN